MDIYINLLYGDYKKLEQQLRNMDECETSHTSVEGFYHKSISFQVGDTRFEFHGPLVKAAEHEQEKVCSNCGCPYPTRSHVCEVPE